jgi:hypothetical protein
MLRERLRTTAKPCVLTALIALTALAATAPAAQALPGMFWGVVPQATPSAEQLQRLKRGGVESIRIPLSWGGLQPTEGAAVDWSGIDTLVGNAATAGIEVLPFLYGAPVWAVPADSSLSSHPPRFLPVRSGKQRAGWTSFLEQAVLRYGPSGSFWAENPAIPMRPIRVWQIWNEENFKYFVARPNPAEYGKLVKLSYPAIKGADPGAKIVLGGMFARPIEALDRRGPRQAYFAADFLTQMYERTPGIKSKFQGVALHPYTGTYQRLAPYIEEIRTALKVSHDAGKGLWLTELGWSSQHPRPGNSFSKGRGGQATQLKGAFRLLRANQSKWHLQGVYWFSIDDQPGSCNFCGGSGLFGRGFAPKPAWFAYVKFAGGTPG